MQVLLVDKMTHRLDRCLVSFLEAGIQVIGSGSVAVADTCLQRHVVDLLVITAEAAGKGTRKLINLAELRNPNVATILLAADVERASAIAAQSLPSVHCTLSTDSTPDQIMRFAMASLRPTAMSDVPVRRAAPTPPEVFAAEPLQQQAQSEEASVVFSSSRKRGARAPTARAA